MWIKPAKIARSLIPGNFVEFRTFRARKGCITTLRVVVGNTKKAVQTRPLLPELGAERTMFLDSLSRYKMVDGWVFVSRGHRPAHLAFRVLSSEEVHEGNLTSLLDNAAIVVRL